MAVAVKENISLDILDKVDIRVGTIKFWHNPKNRFLTEQELGKIENRNTAKSRFLKYGSFFIE